MPLAKRGMKEGIEKETRNDEIGDEGEAQVLSHNERMVERLQSLSREIKASLKTLELQEKTEDVDHRAGIKILLKMTALKPIWSKILLFPKKMSAHDN